MPTVQFGYNHPHVFRATRSCSNSERGRNQREEIACPGAHSESVGLASGVLSHLTAQTSPGGWGSPLTSRGRRCGVEEGRGPAPNCSFWSSQLQRAIMVTTEQKGADPPGAGAAGISETPFDHRTEPSSEWNIHCCRWIHT